MSILDAEKFDASAAEARRRARLAKPWHWDAPLIDELCIGNLPKFLAAIETGAAVAMMALPEWWGGEGVPLAARKRHDLRRGYPHTICVRAKPDAMHLLCIHIPTGQWREPSLSLAGETYTSLAASRWAMSETKAAWRLAKLFGWRAPHLP